MAMTPLQRLSNRLQAAGIPIHGIGSLTAGAIGPGNVRVDYKAEATAQQKTRGAAIVAAFDWNTVHQSAAKEITWEDTLSGGAAVQVADGCRQGVSGTFSAATLAGTAAGGVVPLVKPGTSAVLFTATEYGGVTSLTLAVSATGLVTLQRSGAAFLRAFVRLTVL